MKSATHRTITQSLFVATVTLALSCASPERVTNRVVEEIWSVSDFHRHIEALNAGGGAGQRAGSLQYSAATNYIVGQYRASQLHPGHATFLVPFYVDRNFVSSFSIRASSEDTLRILPGIDTAPAGWTGTGRRTINQFSRSMPSLGTDISSMAIVIDNEPISPALNQSLRKLRRPTVFTIGPLSSETSSTSIDSVVAVQLTTESFARLVGVSAFGVQSIMGSPSGWVFNFIEPITVSTESKFDRRVQESNIIGIVPGKRPGYSDDLIVVVATIGVGGAFGGMPTYRFTSLGIGTSVVLEVSSQVARMSRYSSRPHRSIMFANIYSGDTDKSGIRAFFNNPVWSKASVKKFLLVGLQESDAQLFTSLAADVNLDVEVFQANPPDGMNNEGFLSRPQWVEHVADRSTHVTAIDRRIFAAAKDSAAAEALRLGNLVMERLEELMAEPAPRRTLERNANQE